MKKKTVVLRFSLLASAITLAGVIGGCGGGGGGGGGAAVSDPTITAIVAPGSGIYRNAHVIATCGIGAGTPTIAEGDTLANDTGTLKAGQVRLQWAQSACAKSHVKLAVKGKADGTTTFEDEIAYKKATTLDERTVATSNLLGAGVDAGLSAYIDLADSGSQGDLTKQADGGYLVTKPIVTITRNAVADLESFVAAHPTTAPKPGQLKEFEEAAIKNMAGDSVAALTARTALPIAVDKQPTTIGEQALTDLLVSFSAVANSATCAASVSVADKVTCAANALTASHQASRTVAASGTTTLTGGNNTPAKLLQAALDEAPIKAVIAADPETANSTIMDAIATQASAAAVTGEVTTTPAPLATARDLFVHLSNDQKALSNSNHSGFLDTKIADVDADWQATGISGSTTSGLVNVLTALDRATAMANLAKTADWTVSGTLQGNAVYATPDSKVFLLTNAAGAPDAYIRFFDYGAPSYMSCKVLVSEKALGKAGCYYPTGQANSAVTAGVFTGYYHAVEVAAGSTSGSYTWSDYTASRAYSTQGYANSLAVTWAGGNDTHVPAGSPVPGAAQSGAATTVARDASGNLTSATFSGNILPLISGQDHSTLAVSMATASSTATTQTYNLSGSVTVTPTVTLTLKTGSQLAVATGTTEHVDSLNLAAEVRTTGFLYEGTLVMNTFTASKNGEFSPAYTKFEGKMSTLSGATATEFLNGSLVVRMTNLADYDPRLPNSSTNFIKETDTFSGKLTASIGGLPMVYQLSYSIDGSTYGQQSLTLAYTNPASQLISITGTSYAAGSTSAPTATITSGNIVVSLTNGVGDVKVSGTKVGEVTKSGVFFTDNTFLLM